jgi:hypothetical protein
MAELENLENAEKQKGLLAEDAAPVKLALNVVVPDAAPEKAKEPATDAVQTKPKPRAALDFGGDDDEYDGGGRRKRQTFVKLEADAGSSGAGMSAAEREALRTAKLLEVKADLPSGPAVLRANVQWKSIDEVSLLQAPGTSI